MSKAAFEHIYADGLVIAPNEASNGEVVYAELVPATPLLTWQRFGRPGWRKLWPLGIGRVWWQPHIRWWYEIHSVAAPATKDNPLSIGTHYYQRDGGTTTLRQAIWKASEAVSDTIVDIEAEAAQ